MILKTRVNFRKAPFLFFILEKNKNREYQKNYFEFFLIKLTNILTKVNNLRIL